MQQGPSSPALGAEMRSQVCEGDRQAPPVHQAIRPASTHLTRLPAQPTCLPVGDARGRRPPALEERSRVPGGAGPLPAPTDLPPPGVCPAPPSPYVPRTGPTWLCPLPSRRKATPSAALSSQPGAAQDRGCPWGSELEDPSFWGDAGAWLGPGGGHESWGGGTGQCPGLGVAWHGWSGAGCSHSM